MENQLAIYFSLLDLTVPLSHTGYHWVDVSPFPAVLASFSTPPKHVFLVPAVYALVPPLSSFVSASALPPTSEQRPRQYLRPRLQQVIVPL
jgi:hypothetical protein